MFLNPVGSAPLNSQPWAAAPALLGRLEGPWAEEAQILLLPAQYFLSSYGSDYFFVSFLQEGTLVPIFLSTHPKQLYIIVLSVMENLF